MVAMLALTRFREVSILDDELGRFRLEASPAEMLEPTRLMALSTLEDELDSSWLEV